LTADDDLLSAAYVKSKAWDQNQQSMTTDDLRKAFARKIGLRILLDIGQLRKTIQNGVQTGVWVYYDAGEQFGYDKDTPPQHWRIGEDAILYVPEEAARLQIRIKGKWQPPVEGGKTATSLATCPVCGRPEDQCICGVEVPGRRTIPAKLQGQGAVAQAFQKIVDEGQEYGIARLRQVFIRIEGAGKQAAGELRAIGLAVPQFGKGRYGVELEVIAAFGSGANAESFRQEFKGGWDRYKRLKSVAESFGQEADELRVTMRVGAEFEDGLEVDGQQFQTIRDVLVTLGVGKVVIEAVPHVA